MYVLAYAVDAVVKDNGGSHFSPRLRYLRRSVEQRELHRRFRTSPFLERLEWLRVPWGGDEEDGVAVNYQICQLSTIKFVHGRAQMYNCYHVFQKSYPGCCASASPDRTGTVVYNNEDKRSDFCLPMLWLSYGFSLSFLFSSSSASPCMGRRINSSS